MFFRAYIRLVSNAEGKNKMTQEQFEAAQAYNVRQAEYVEEVVDFANSFDADEIESALLAGCIVFCEIDHEGKPGTILATTPVITIAKMIETGLRDSGQHFYVIDSEHTVGYRVV
jgi:hypothetical protein